MKKKRYTLIAAWLLLFCFIAGQAVVYSHQHHILKGIHHTDAQAKGRTQVSEKCQICDSMHHADMALHQNYVAFDLQATLFNHPSVKFEFKPFGLILADGLSPPVFILS
ncbi:hypothetical protein LJ707_18325 [Mucilaginibacter sp. UR6-1]|uniref:hypothetical protein n=1 Tax=Mucilaginibacter sp. UR6-1 TaxID=1435643 RepID=UPI001E2A02F9|nr:hypothetical protein [Mucilaginibacter sp. UR6-1]MCC8410903.1 hypothetical protein [Mucilaginibacter sp. UR6-1]